MKTETDNFDAEYWNNRFRISDTPWDTGSITTPLKNYFDQLTDKNIKILIPGAGNAHEAEYLYLKGFKNVFVLDISIEAVVNFKSRVPNFNIHHIVHEDFFEHQGKYDLIVEQTFFCALHPSLRKKYAQKMHSLLNSNGKLVGLLFNDTLNDDKPPFGGNMEEYKILFSPIFNLKVFEIAHNSIKPRNGREIFIILQKTTIID